VSDKGRFGTTPLIIRGVRSLAQTAVDSSLWTRTDLPPAASTKGHLARNRKVAFALRLGHAANHDEWPRRLPGYRESAGPGVYFAVLRRTVVTVTTKRATAGSPRLSAPREDGRAERMAQFVHPERALPKPHTIGLPIAMTDAPGWGSSRRFMGTRSPGSSPLALGGWEPRQT
jgi:hypothetical protein